MNPALSGSTGRLGSVILTWRKSRKAPSASLPTGFLLANGPERLAYVILKLGGDILLNQVLQTGWPQSLPLEALFGRQTGEGKGCSYSSGGLDEAEPHEAGFLCASSTMRGVCGERTQTRHPPEQSHPREKVNSHLCNTCRKRRSPACICPSPP